MSTPDIRNCTGIVLTPLGEGDVAAVAAIERLCFSDPWSEQAISLMYSSAHAHAIAARDALTGSLVGYVGFEYALDEADLTNIAVHPDYRRRGIGLSLLTAAEKSSYRLGVRVVTLSVRKSNYPALGLYRLAGYTAVGIRPRYYRHPSEDAVIMTKNIDSR